MRFFKRPEIMVPITFMVISSLWIILSDKFFLQLQQNVSIYRITEIQTIKGCCFVLLVTAMIHLLIKLANKKLVQSEEEYKELFYNTNEPTFIIDSGTAKFTTVNKAAVENYGYSFQEFSKMSINDVRAIDCKEQLKYANNENIVCHKKKNRETIICQESQRNICFKSKPASILSAHDITELEKAKAEIIQRELQLNLVLNSITDGFFIINADFEIEKANEQFKRLVEINEDCIIGKRLEELFPSFVNTYAHKQYLYAIQHNESVHFENLYSKSNSWFRITCYPFEGGLSVIFRDITKEKLDELQIHRNEQNLLALINNTEDLIWSIDSNFRYFTFNEPYEKAYTSAFQEELWIGKIALNENQGAEHMKKWKGLYERALKGEKFSVDMNFVLENQIKSTTVRFNPIYNAEDKVIGVGCFLQNTTELKLNERRIEQQNQQLKKIAYITSHKVRAPLTNILGLVEILDKDHPLSIDNTTIIEHIKASALQLDRTIINMVEQTVQLNDIQ